MQLGMKLSLFTCTLLACSTAQAEDYVSVQYVHYDEDSGRTTVMSPALEVSKDFGTDYTLKASFVLDSISGASPSWYDASSGASAASRGVTALDNVTYDNIEYDDSRTAAALSLTTRFDSRDELTVGFSHSYENDYSAYELSAEYLHYLDSSKNQSVSFGASYQMNEVLVYCGGNSICDATSAASRKLRDDDDDDDDDDYDDYDSSSGASQAMDVNVLTAELGFTQVINANTLAKASVFFINEDGYLSNPYMNVVRNYNQNNSGTAEVTAENKPDTRTSYGLTLQYITALSDTISSNTSYRFYNDDWGIVSHTINTELYYEYGDNWMFGAGLRYYMQSEADFYNANKDYFTDETYASSDRRMSDFDALSYKVSVLYRVSSDWSVNTGVTYYDQSKHFDAIYYTLGLKYSF